MRFVVFMSNDSPEATGDLFLVTELELSAGSLF